MAIYSYKKFKISLNPNSSKIQGLRVGDIVRRQYFDNQLKRNNDGTYTGKDVGVIYSLMCVLSIGVDMVDLKDTDGNPITDDAGTIVQQKRPWFIGALLEGSVPKDGELLDFVRITSLYDTNRSGALYLTASDDYAPFMDIIDGIGRDASLCWPEDICTTGDPDHESQYVLQGAVVGEYIPSDVDGHNRIAHLTKSTGSANFTGISQEFYKYVSNPNMVLVSYRAKASTQITAEISLEYVNGSKSDGMDSVQYDTDWRYYFHAITVDWSGRHLRTVKIDLGNAASGDEIWISDFNIILLSSVSNFKDSSKIRIGKLNGVVDPVFGRLDGYGSYLQKLFASQSAHISGTLTAGDENGFGASFYAGKIHKNILINSLGLNTLGAAIYADQSTDPLSPTGVGKMLKLTRPESLIVQSNAWLYQLDKENRYTHIGANYTFSFWVYCKQPCVIELSQNSNSIGALYINALQTHTWVRLHKTFTLSELPPELIGDDLTITIAPIFKSIVDPVFGESFKNDDFTTPSDVEQDSQIEDAEVLYFSSPQLESGTLATQYQATDDQLNYTDEYGAWFNRGGIGGTIQNPLLRLNDDGKGSISTNTNSLRLQNDGSGHVAKGNIKWDEDGNVEFSDNVKLSWSNLSSDAKDNIVGKSLRIIGQDTFTPQSLTENTWLPSTISLTAEYSGNSTAVTYQWLYYDIVAQDYKEINNATEKTFEVYPDADIWQDQSFVTLKILANDNQILYADTITIKKTFQSEYTLVVTSSQGVSFKNGKCQTVLTANVYRYGKLLTANEIQNNLTFQWDKYLSIDQLTPEVGWWEEKTDAQGNVIRPVINRNAQSIVIDEELVSQAVYKCRLLNSDVFPYNFPIEITA